mmetsp:Transcript_3080/g.5618  ORF Transcript_3080/g.5618 Transcript_3080/m.5618 type:complete len:167 (-) Transcript_3080:1574-2074(-)
MKAASTTLALMLFPGATAALRNGIKKSLGRSITTSNDDPAMTDAPPSSEELCSAFMIYDFLTRRLQRERPVGDRVNIDWSSVCPILEDLNPQLCPTGHYLVDICTEPYKVELNPSVKNDYCMPLLSEIEKEKDFWHCVRACVRYVSRDRGDCCQFECPEEGSSLRV